MTATLLTQNLFVIDAKSIQKAASIYRAINHSVRLQIIELIHKAGALNGTLIVQTLKFEQPVNSAHLKILRDAKIVKAERKGNSAFYSINYPQINRISLLAEKLIPYRGDTSTFHHNINHKPTIKSRAKATTFTPTELKIIQLVCRENTTEEIAGKLGIAKRTVEDHRSNIIKKMKVRNSVGILFFAIKNGLFKI
jgi:DNA-binding CsgD family transcriptional regulator/DNA-binding transcriptional ArsR family regulator